MIPREPGIRLSKDVFLLIDDPSMVRELQSRLLVQHGMMSRPGKQKGADGIYLPTERSRQEASRVASHLRSRHAGMKPGHSEGFILGALKDPGRVASLGIILSVIGLAVFGLLRK